MDQPSLPATGFTYAQGRAAGLTRHRLYRADLQRPFRGVRTIEADLDDHTALCRAYATREHAGDVFSHTTAALLHGLPLPPQHLPAKVHVAVFAPRKPSRVAGIVGHELRAAGHRIVTIGGLRCLSAEDTWAQLSSILRVEDLVVIGDYLVTGDEPYSGRPSPWTHDHLLAALKRHGRRPGVRNLRLALELVRFGSLSPQESRLRLELVAAGLPEPALNHRVVHRGAFVAMVDLAYPDNRVAVEYLGDHHRTDRAVYQQDIYRRERLAAAGWDTVFVTSADLAPPIPRAVLSVRRALSRSIPH